MLMRNGIRSNGDSGAKVGPFERDLYFWLRIRDRLLFRFFLRYRRAVALKRLS